MMSFYNLSIFGALLSLLYCHKSDGSAVQLQSHNIDDILLHNEVVLVNFYADWCRFSQLLSPVYDEAAKKVAEQFPESGKVALGKVDCDRETAIAQKYQVSKYPTLKLFRNGQLVKREYRGQRSAEAMSKFISDQLVDHVVSHPNLDSLDDIDKKKRHVIGYFDDSDSHDYQAFRKVGSILRDDCAFHAVIGEASGEERNAGNKVVFRPSGELATDLLYSGPISDTKHLQNWAVDKCVPLVREITFENAEELTEEGLPFLILFHSKDDDETPEKFKKMVSLELLPEKNSVNFLVADGEKFTHPLYHLGKTLKDLPVLAIDSFRHMYLWKEDPKTKLETPGLLRAFIKDLQSGKLHREFHHGPDPTTGAPGVEGSNQGDTALASVGDHGGNHDNTLHFNVQQQLIVHSNGMRMQVVRFVQIGSQQPVDLREHLLAAGTDLHSNEHHNNTGDPDQAVLDKVVADFFADTSKDVDSDEGDTEPRDTLNALEKEDNSDGFHKRLQSEVDKSVNDQTAHHNPRILLKPAPTLSPGDARKQWEQLNSNPRHQGHHHGNQGSLDDQSNHGEPNSKSYTKVTQVQMKLADGEGPPASPSPPESIFRKLGPSRDRYTILREDL